VSFLIQIIVSDVASFASFIFDSCLVILRMLVGLNDTFRAFLNGQAVLTAVFLNLADALG